jgi:hypothetical protein
VWGLLEGQLDPAEPLVMLLPEQLRLRAEGVQVRRVPKPLDWAHPARRPQVLTVEHTVLELVRVARSDADAVDAILCACRMRMTSPPRILAAARSRARIRRRALVGEVCGEVLAGVSSPLERRYRRDVALAHGLPEAAAQQPATGWGGATVYRDLRYDPFGVIIELDGRLGHEREAEAFRDQFRDNAATLTGQATLRFGWLAVAGHRCAVAGQVGALLTLRGWRGSLRPCCLGCTADPRWAGVA